MKINNKAWQFISQTSFGKKKIICMILIFTLFCVLLTASLFVVCNQEKSVNMTPDDRLELLATYQRERDKTSDLLALHAAEMPKHLYDRYTQLLAEYDFYLSTNTVQHDYVHLTVLGGIVSPLGDTTKAMRPFVALMVLTIASVAFAIFYTQQLFLIGYGNKTLKTIFSTSLTRKTYWLTNFVIWLSGILLASFGATIVIALTNLGNPTTCVMLWKNGVWSSYSLSSILWIKHIGMLVNMSFLSALTLFCGTFARNSNYVVGFTLGTFAVSLVLSAILGSDFGQFGIANIIPWLSAISVDLWNSWQTYATWGVTIFLSIAMFALSYSKFKRQDLL
ncbi:MAG: hypothetical protein RR416_00765 [Clostridia bacterium]